MVPVVRRSVSADGRTNRPSATDIPPPRYRIVERGRRLEVIDTHAGRGPAVGDGGTPTTRNWPGARQVSFDGAADLTTQPFYDDHGPRTIRLSPDRAAIVARVKLGTLIAAIVLVAAAIKAPWVLLLPFAVFSDAIRKPARRAVTAWLDQAARETDRGQAGTSSSAG